MIRGGDREGTRLIRAGIHQGASLISGSWDDQIIKQKLPIFVFLNPLHNVARTVWAAERKKKFRAVLHSPTGNDVPSIPTS